MRETVDFALRLAFFAVAPFSLVWIAQLFPIAGALVQIALALTVFYLAERVRRLPLAKRVLARDLRFEEFYREHTPRPFYQYVLSPIFVWVWLFTRRGRRELILYKGYTWPTFAFLVLSLLLQYVRDFPPQLHFAEFYPLALGTFAAETLAVLMFLMPLVTSVVHMHLTRAPRRLSILLFAGLISVGFAVARIAERRDPIVSFATRTRVRLRQQADPARAQAAHLAALRTGWALLPKNRDEIEPDGKVEGTSLEAAHEQLTSFYKNDEAHAFELWLSRSRRARTLVVFFPVHRGRDPIWTAMDETGQLTTDPTVLRRGLQRAMGLSTKSSRYSGRR